MKYIQKCLLLLFGVLLLTGCSVISGGDDLLQVPKPSENFVLLQDQLEELINEGKTYVAPQSGAYRNTVTFEDIDGDGTDEAIALMRDGTGGKIYVYAFARENGEYKKIGSVQGPGSTLGSMSFADVEGGKRKLIVLTWVLSGDVRQGLTVCGVRSSHLTELLTTTCTDYIVCDMDRDDSDELFTLSYDETERKSASVFDYAKDRMQLLAQADATQDVQTIANLTGGQLEESGIPAVFADNKFENDNGMQTDIYVLDGSALRNIALSSDTSTYRSTTLYYSSDIDGDGSIEIPQLQALPGFEERESSETLYLIDWYRYSTGGTAELVYSTFDSPAEGWTLEFPAKWRGDVTAEVTNDAGMTQTVFSAMESPEEPLLTICSFTGEERKKQAEQSDMIQLGSTADICYAARLGSSAQKDDDAFALTEKDVRRMFTVITKEWK